MNRSIIILFIFSLSGCISAPTNKLDARKQDLVLPVEFPTNDSINGQASFTIKVRYDGLHDEADAKKRRLQEGIARGIQTLFSIPSFVAVAKSEGSVRYESMTVNYRGETCNPQSLELMQDEWKDPNADRIKTLCELEVLRGGLFFASTDAFLENSKLVNATVRESGYYSETGDSYLKSYPEELIASSSSNPKSPTFEIGADAVHGLNRGLRRATEINLHPQKQNYIRKHLFSIGDRTTSASGYLIHSVIGKHKVGDKWAQIIPNVAFVKKMRRMIPRISKEDYSELAKRIREKLTKYDLNHLVEECNTQSVSDICIVSAPLDYETNVTQKKNLEELLKHYVQLAKLVTKDYSYDLEKQVNYSWANGYSGPVLSKEQLANLHEYARDAASIEAAESAIIDLWGFLLIDATEIIAQRSGDSVELKFVIDFQKIFSSYKFLTI